MKKKKISLKVSSLAILAGVLSTASVISIAATTFSRNSLTSNTVNNTATTDLLSTQASTVASNQSTPTSITGVKTKITSYNVARPSNVETEWTYLSSRYGKEGFEYPGVNNDYSNFYNRSVYDSGKWIDLSNDVLGETTLLAYNNATNSVWTTYNDARYINSYLSKGKHYKHPAADGLYVNKIPANVKAVTKQFNVNTNVKGSVSLGLFAAPGEPFTLTFDKDTFDTLSKQKFSGLEVIVNENNFENYGASVPTKLTNRYPYTKTKFTIDPKKRSVTLESPFGGMISLNVTGKAFNQNLELNQNNSNWVKFEVSGALETLQYIQGETTQSSWQNQINKLKNGSIYASAVSLVGQFGSVIIPATGPNEFGGVKVDDMVYPDAVMKKWSDLGFLGAYLSSRDSTGDATRISYNFSNESYWGGGVTSEGKTGFYAPINSGGTAFLTGIDGFNSTKSQELLNGLGLDYKQSSVLFKGSDSNKASQAIIPLLGMLDDNTRSRNTVGVYGDSNSFQDAYQTVKKIRNKQGNDQASIYTLLLYTVGPDNYISYVRWATQNNLNTKAGWTPMKEIEAMSNFFGINLYQAFANTNATWAGGWAKNYSSASKEDKAIIDRLQAKYPAMDFVANMYASGNYLLNTGNSKWTYSGDYAPAYQITAGEDYTFDFGKFINSTSNSFNWSKLHVDVKSANGVELQVDKKDSRKVIYKAGSKFVPEDEFLVTIYPNFVNNKLKNYVPSYTWKIKVKQVTNSALVSTYNSNTSYKAVDLLNNLRSNNAKNVTLTNESYDLYSNKNNYFTTNKNTSVRYRFKFVAPKTGRYIFSNVYSDSIAVYANNKLLYHDEKSSSTYKNSVSATLYKGQYVDFDVLVTSASGAGTFNMAVDYADTLVPLPFIKTTRLSFWDNVTTQNIDKVKTLAGLSSLADFTSNQKYVYKPRSINYFDYGNNAIYKMGATEYNYSVLDTKLYNLQPVKNVSQDVLNRLNSQYTNFEVWNKNFVEFNLNFKTPTNVSSLVFSHRLDNHTSSKPEYIRIDATTESGQKINLYQGAYGGQFNDKNQAWSGLNFTGNQKYKSLSFYITSNDKAKSIVLKRLYVSSAKYYPTANWSVYSDIKFNSSK